MVEGLVASGDAELLERRTKSQALIEDSMAELVVGGRQTLVQVTKCPCDWSPSFALALPRVIQDELHQAAKVGHLRGHHRARPRDVIGEIAVSVRTSKVVARSSTFGEN